MQRRRDFLRRTGLAGAGVLTFGSGFWSQALAAAERGPSPYGRLRAPDENGLRLPEGFRSRVIAQGRLPVPNTTYPWHQFSDGAATYQRSNGGWILVSNSEVPAG